MTNSTFPDQFGVEFIRDALWHVSGGRAAVMVGAGFSRNARPTSSASRQMPSWLQMSESLCRLLYAASSDEARKQALRDANSTSGFLRLAQEYEAAFGRIALNEQIRGLVPDMEYEPDDVHTRLLNLPWSDVLTTNWDTLLERTSRDIFQRSYDVVRTSSEIPTARRPRIVKLHGSFPANEPFIFTEDDYRTYPRSHAPFVNLVQQSLMESVLCLIGFSGDDPNFLYWSGWVRDNLGTNAPKIYLVGWLELSPHKRRMLEDRNVAPIDLANLPIAHTWPADQRHRYATEWFIRTISNENRFEPTNWPHVAPEQNFTPSYLGVLPSPSESLPIVEVSAPDFQKKDMDERQEAVREVAETWRWNRTLYPGWMVAPSGVRQSIWQHTSNWIHEICLLEAHMPSTEFLRILSELVWRLDLSLAPFFTDLIQCSERVLATVDIATKLIRDKEGTMQTLSSGNWTEVASTWCTVALMVVRASRVDGQIMAVTALQTTLVECALHSTELRNQVTYESCLLLRDRGEFAALIERLSTWDIATSDTAWAIRKAGLFVGVGDLDGANRCFRLALIEIRRHRRRDCIDFQAFSREGWALWFQAADEIWSELGTSVYLNGPKSKNRWLELGIYLCDASRDFYTLVSNLDASASKPRAGKIVEKQFDLGSASQSVKFANGLPEDIRHAHEVLRLAEAAGIPSSMNRVDLFADGLRKAIRILQSEESWICALWSMRVASAPNDDALNYFTRTRVATFAAVHLSQLRTILQAEINSALSYRTTPAYVRHWSARLAVAVEVLSRLVVRCSAEDSIAIFLQTLQFFSNPVFQGDRTLSSPLKNLLRRVIESVPRDFLAGSIIDLFGLPLLQGRDSEWPEPAEVLPHNFAIKAVNIGNREFKWKEIIHHLCKDCSGGELVVAQRALHRLYLLNEYGLLTDEEKAELADFLWGPDNLDDTGWPRRFGIADFAIIALPEKIAGQALGALRQRYLSVTDKGKTVEERVAFVGTALNYAQTKNITFALNKAEKATITCEILTWAKMTIEPRRSDLHLFFSSLGNKIDDGDVLLGLTELLPNLPLTSAEAEVIWTRAEGGERDFPSQTLEFFPIMLLFLSERLEQVNQKLREGLVSDTEAVCQGACKGMFRWMRQHELQPEAIAAPDDDLVREIGNGIAVRRRAMLIAGLGFATWLIKEGPVAWRSSFLSNAVLGLKYLLEEAKYDGPYSNTDVDLPLLRLRCVQLARAIFASGNVSNAAVNEWCNIAVDDPLPEIRHTLSDRGTIDNPILIYK